MKNILVCCDGTNNQLNGDLTNVVRLYQVATKSDQQATYYDPGVGTLPDPLARSSWDKRWTLVTGLAFATGFDDNVFDAYRYLMSVYEPGDRVFLSGFSRGAFTVRVLAGMLHSVGLLHAGSEQLLPYAWTYYRAGINPTGFEVCDFVKQELARPCPVAFLGVWDTVGSVGMYNYNEAFPFSFSNPDVERVRHAVSLDEKRAAFRSNIFKPDSTLQADGRPRVINAWFPGVHSDVGGGYSRETSGLAMGAFLWMVYEAQKAGLFVDKARLTKLLQDYPPSATGTLHESLQGGWKAIEWLPAKRYNWTSKQAEWRWQPNKPRELRDGVILHESLLERISKVDSYRPLNLSTHDITELARQYPIEKTVEQPPQ